MEFVITWVVGDRREDVVVTADDAAGAVQAAMGEIPIGCLPLLPRGSVLTPGLTIGDSDPIPAGDLSWSVERPAAGHAILCEPLDNGSGVPDSIGPEHRSVIGPIIRQIRNEFPEAEILGDPEIGLPWTLSLGKGRHGEGFTDAALLKAYLIGWSNALYRMTL